MNRKSLVCILVGLYLGLTALMTFAQTQKSHSPALPTMPSTVGQTVTLLPDGNLLLVGGADQDGRPVADVVLFDTRTHEQRPMAALNFPRNWHTSTVLPDGTVLVLGGIGTDGQVVKESEIFDPRAATVQTLASAAPLPRAFHSATLLTDGQLLIVGGAGSDGSLLRTAELWDPRQKTSTTVSLPSDAMRRNHTAALQADGRVIFSGGKNEAGALSSADEFFDPQSQVFSLAPSGQLSSPANKGITEITATLPEDGSANVAWDALITMRFSSPVQMQSINDQTLVLSGPFGIVDARIVAAENGMLAFITPNSPLLPDTTYTIRFSGVLDTHNAWAAFREFKFTTAGDTTPSDLWVPSADWMTHGATTKWQSLSPLRAAPGVIALSGQVLKLDGTPLPHVTLQIGAHKSESDETGRFLMTGIAAGHNVMRILADAANTPLRKYGVYEVGVDIQAGITNVLPYTIWMTALDTAHAVKIASPTNSETVVTSPFLPGLELHIPPNTVITDSRGKTVTEITITPVPLNEPPFPLPKIPVPIYFTIQPGISYIKVVNTGGPKGARLFYPNAHGYPPGTPFQFWNYDAETPKGWFIYGNGKVSQNRAQIVPDPGVELYEFTGAMVSNPGNAPNAGPHPGNDNKDGEPVDLGTGLFVYEKTDLALADIIPLTLKRTYRQNDPVSRSFGIGASHQYDMFLVGDNNTFPEGYTFQDLILADGGRIHFARTSPCLGVNGYCDFSNAVYEHTSSNTDYYGAILRFQSCAPSGLWTLTKKDGTVFCFPDSDASNNARTAAPTGMKDRHGNTLIFTRDGSNLTQITSPNGRWIQFTYDTSNRIIQAKDNINRTVSYSYDAGGRLTQVTDANGGVWNYSYDAFNEMISIQDPRGIIFLTNQYDQNGRVVQQTQADNTNYVFHYTTDPTSGNIIQTDVANPLGVTRRTAYDVNGYKTSEIFALGRPEQRTITYDRDPNTELINSVTDSLPRKTAYTYDSFGNVTSVTRLAGTSSAVITSYTYESNFHQIASITDPLNHTTTFAYDGFGNLTTITDPLGKQTNLAYNSQGLAVSVTDPMANLTGFTYDGGDLVSITDPSGSTINRFIDGAGRVLTVTDGLGQVTRYSYTAFDKLLRITDPLQGTTSFTYDADQNLTSMTDALGDSTSWSYDNMNRTTTRVDALLRSEKYTHDQGGNLVSVTDRKGQVTTYKYDGLMRRTFTGFGTQGSGGAATYASTVSYQYDNGNRMTQAADSLSGTIIRAYDNLDRLTSETTPQGSVSYGYDAANRKTSMTVAGQPAVIYSYDDANHLTQITQGSSTTVLGYDLAGRRTSLSQPGGVVTSYSYDSNSRLAGISYQYGASPLGNLAYTYDQAGNRTQLDGSFSRVDLPQPVTLAGYDAANELVNWNGVPASYDSNGNLLSDGVNNFVWDARNQLGSVNGNSLQYDAFGRRIRNSQGTSFFYDGDKAVQEISGGLVSANLLSGGVDEVLGRSETSGSFTPLVDALGSTLGLLDSTGNIQTSYSYDPFGLTSATGQAASNIFQFTGRENDGNGLYNYRARYYNARLGRFISEDPLGVSRGANSYAYVGDNPASWIDPYGYGPKDKWYGYNNRDFQDWFHRQWKQEGDPDATKEEMEDAYRQWEDEGRPSRDPKKNRRNNNNNNDDDENNDNCRNTGPDPSPAPAPDPVPQSEPGNDPLSQMGRWIGDHPGTVIVVGVVVAGTAIILTGGAAAPAVALAF
jgi:RHS repeat-associated protein